MRIQSLKHAVALTQKGVGPLTEICKGAVEVGFIVPSILKKGLEDAGYIVQYLSPGDESKEHKTTKVLHRASVYCPIEGAEPAIVAHGMSDSVQDALLQAIYAAMKEENPDLKDPEATTAVVIP
jgi:hypothetical protein